MKVLVETSARHIHLTKEHVEALFGKGKSLTAKKELSQPGEFVCNERVNIIGPKKRMDNVAVLGPERAATQVEISLTDARNLGVTPPVRESGDVAGSAGIIIEGPAGPVEIPEGVIAAKRHVHMTPEDAAAAGVENRQIISVKIDGPRALVFEEVVVRVSEKFATAMHVDTDEANAVGSPGVCHGELIV